MIELRQFFGAYFHQDWELEHSTPEQVVEDYLRTNSAEAASRSAEQIDELLGRGASPMELERILFHELGCYYDPKPDGVTVHDWLIEIRDLLRGRKRIT